NRMPKAGRRRWWGAGAERRRREGEPDAEGGATKEPLSQQVLGGLADLPVPVGEGPGQGRLDLGALEGREGDHRPPAHRRLVGGGGEDGGQRGLVADGAEGGDRRLAA